MRYSSVCNYRIGLNDQSRSIGYCCATYIANISQNDPILIAVVGRGRICNRQSIRSRVRIYPSVRQIDPNGPIEELPLIGSYVCRRNRNWCTAAWTNSSIYWLRGN